MSILIQNITVADPSSPFDGKQTDLLVDKGMIVSIGKKIPAGNHELLDGKGSFISPGWCDMRAHYCEPGYEQKETLESGMSASQRGGFTAVALVPETKPALHSKAEIEFIRNKTASNLMEVLPYGALTHDLDGKTMAEMYDMHSSGAAAFTDGNHAIANAGTMMRSLLYVKNFDGLVITHADDPSLSNQGTMNEGAMSVMLGMKSIPAIAEELIVARDIELLRYTGSRIHFSHISTTGAIEQIARAKKEGLNITCDVAIANLVFDESELSAFDTNYKLNPPLRNKETAGKLIAAVNNGTIDAIVSDHYPQDEEHKLVEFDIASPGMNTAQTFYNLLLKISGQIDTKMLIPALSNNPRKILGLEPARIAENEKANFTIFNPDITWKYDTSSNKSLSKNSPLYNSDVKGKVLAVANKGRIEIFH